jgi:hypothetical protein
MLPSPEAATDLFTLVVQPVLLVGVALGTGGLAAVTAALFLGVGGWGGGGLAVERGNGSSTNP